MAEVAARKKVTIPMLMKKKKEGEPIVQLAVYDYETAIIADRVGIDILCVSDTGGMVLFGHESTTSVSFEEVMFMAQAVKRGSQYGLRMVDMPYMSFHLSAQQAVDNAAKYVSQAGAEVMKCEGNQHHAKYIEAIVKAGIPVQGPLSMSNARVAPAARAGPPNAPGVPLVSTTRHGVTAMNTEPSLMSAIVEIPPDAEEAR